MKKMDNYIDVGPTKAGEKGAACRKQPKKDTLIVYKANTMIQANYQLTLVEQRVLLACIAKINPREPVPSVVRLSAQEYATIYSTQVKASPKIVRCSA
ncbi:MAG: replication initiation protein [Candidatus Thiodiazotropha sp. (ex Rostrolucina anterorostrata)]|nr:replication initiation protein [Candidatus Thiodiazotropha sp. (ex Rostrolucina anterorostrata)]